MRKTIVVVIMLASEYAISLVLQLTKTPEPACLYRIGFDIAFDTFDQYS
jgi:hypothetical protein